MPRHSTLIFWPGSILLMSTSIGAPAALARSLGQNDITNGTAAATAPTPPTTDVAPIRNRRLSLFTIASVPIPAFRRGLSPRCKTFELYGIRAYSFEARGDFRPDCLAETGACNQDSAGTELAALASARRQGALATPTIMAASQGSSAPCCESSGCCSRRRARCASARCSSSRRCAPTCCRACPRKGDNVVLLREATASAPAAAPGPSTYADAAKKAMPAVVNIYTSKAVRTRNPLLDDSILRRYFPDLAERAPTRRARRASGSGVIVVPGGLRPHQPPRDRRRRRHRARARRRPRDAGARQRRRSGIRPRRAEGGRRRTCRRSRSAPSKGCRSATSCSRSAIRSASATP